MIIFKCIYKEPHPGKSRAAAAPGLAHGHLSTRPARAGHAVAAAPLDAPLSTLGEVKRALESAYTRGGERGEAELQWASGCQAVYKAG